MSVSVAVVGATGAVGEELLAILDARRFPVGSLKLFASARSEGRSVRFRDHEHRCERLAPGCFAGVDLVFLDASDEVSAEWVPQALSAGAWVVDNSATYRMGQDVPLVVPEINGHLIRKSASRLVAGPNCSTAQLVLALYPLAKRFGLKRVVVSSYQSVSGAGRAAIDELKGQLAQEQRGETSKASIFPYPIAYECIPQIGKFSGNGQTSEERKIETESRKILGLPDLRITATCVRVPTVRSHAESVNVEFERAATLAQAREALEQQEGVAVVDDPTHRAYPLVRQAAHKDPVFVGRLRVDASVNHGLNFWCVADNLRKGAALNAVQIAESILRLSHA